MDRQSPPPGPEIGWAFGGVGFVATAFAGWLLGAGPGFVLVAVVFWGALGALFAFLVERSAIEEHDRVDELQNARLATLQPAPAAPPVPDERGASRGEGTAAESRGDERARAAA